MAHDQHVWQHKHGDCRDTHLESKYLLQWWFLSNYLLLPPIPASSPTFSQWWNKTINMPGAMPPTSLRVGRFHPICEQPEEESHRHWETGSGGGQARAKCQILQNEILLIQLHWPYLGKPGLQWIQEFDFWSYRHWDKGKLPYLTFSFSTLFVIQRPLLWLRGDIWQQYHNSADIKWLSYYRELLSILVAWKQISLGPKW